MPDLTEQISRLEAGIAAQEALRPTLGDAVVDATLAALQAQLSALRDLRRPRETKPLDYDRPRSYTPKYLADKILTTRSSIEGENKIVTVMFADVVNSTGMFEKLDPEAVHEIMDGCFRLLIDEIHRHEGTINQFLGDGVMALFGAPIAHEDHAQRACHTALAIRKALEPYGESLQNLYGIDFNMRIGLNSGPVVVGSIGDDLRMDYTAKGDTVNTASRLEGASEAGQILVSRDTYRLAREAFTFLAMEPIRVKGKRDPLIVYELHRSRLAPGKSRGLRDLSYAFVGRDHDMAQLKDIFAGLEVGRGQMVVVSGEAGIGKSRLLSELKRDITSREEVHWLEGRCLAYTSSVPYGPFLELIRNHAGIRDELSEDHARRRLDLAVNQFSPGDAETKAIIANMMLLRLSSEEINLLKGIQGELLRQRIFGLMVSFFTNLAEEHPTMLVIEDSHWADATSLELIEHLIPLTERLSLAIICVSRTETSETSEAWMRLITKLRERCSDGFTNITLKPLSELGSLEMTARLLSLKNLPLALKELIAGRAEGNPFFVEELVRTLIERGALAQSEEGGWQATRLIESVTVPDTLQGLLMSRLDRLPPETKWLAQQASVIGRIFLYRVLLHMAERETDVDNDLSCMETNELIQERAHHPELEYMFRHALTQETAYQSLLAARRKELHCKTAQAIEELYSDRIAEFFTVIGEHFLRGEAWDRAFEYLIRAGDTATRLFALAEARLHYARALDALAHLPSTENNRRSKVDALIKQVSVSYAADSPEQNMARMNEADRLVQELPGPDGIPGSDQLPLARVRFWMGMIHFVSNAMPEAIMYYRQVLAVAQKLGDPELLAVPSSAIGGALYFQGHFGKAKALFHQAITAFEQLGDWTEWIRAVAYHGATLGATGFYAEGLAECQRALARARELNSLYGIANSALGLSRIYADAGNLACATEISRQVIEAAEQSGDRILVNLCYGNRAYAGLCAGQFEAAAESIAKCQAIAQEFGGQLAGVDITASTIAEMVLGKGQVEQALSLAEQAVAMAEKTGGIWAEGMARQVWGRSLAAINPPKWDEAEAQMAESLRLFELGEARLYAARIRMYWGIICRDRAKIDTAREHFEKAAAQWTGSNIPWELERVNKLIAELPKA
ncbi:MAG: adenylate/guanylate cyclase domain-containing protein [Syntrophobacteraceae bacterium]|jgi:class 3 adenylate cyclase/tetratricopeptide (TPR) repeat protein